MTNKLKKEKEQTFLPQEKELCIHFNTENHQISIEQFEQTLNSYKLIAKDFAENIFEIKSGLKIYVLPPQNGGFEVLLKILIDNPAISAILAALAYDAIKGLVKGLTKNSKNKKFKDGITPELCAEVFGETIQGFMKETASDIEILEAKINSEYKPKKSINLDISKKQKADFYAECIKNKGIMGIGFSHEHEFPLSRNDFIERAIPPVTKPLPEKEKLKKLIIVKSVNTDEKLQWEFKDVDTKEAFSANIEDKEFNENFLNGKYPLKKNSSPDKILALVQFNKKLENGKEKKDSYIIKAVYKFNQQKLKERPKGLRRNRSLKQNDAYKQLNLNFYKNVKRQNTKD